MDICVECGSELRPNSKFCPKCGSPTPKDFSKVEVEEADEAEEAVRKCPRCGEPLKSFVAYCPAYGYELRGESAARSISIFASKIEGIERERIAKKKKEPRSFFQNTARESGEIDEISLREISLIKTFPIPNTLEDICEFVILATSSVDPNSYDYDLNGVCGTAARRAISDAWIAKSEQALEKGRIVLGDSSELQRMDGLVAEAKKRVEKGKRARLFADVPAVLNFFLVFSIIMALGTAMILIPLAFMKPVNEQRIEDQETRFAELIVNAETSLSNKEYVRALRYAQAIEFDDYDTGEEHKDKEIFWDTERDALIERITKEADAAGVDLSVYLE